MARPQPWDTTAHSAYTKCAARTSTPRCLKVTTGTVRDDAAADIYIFDHRLDRLHPALPPPRRRPRLGQAFRSWLHEGHRRDGLAYLYTVVRQGSLVPVSGRGKVAQHLHDVARHGVLAAFAGSRHWPRVHR
jgi:hypothetical protein